MMLDQLNENIMIKNFIISLIVVYTVIFLPSPQLITSDFSADFYFAIKVGLFSCFMGLLLENILYFTFNRYLFLKKLFKKKRARLVFLLLLSLINWFVIRYILMIAITA